MSRRVPPRPPDRYHWRGQAADLNPRPETRRQVAAYAEWIRRVYGRPRPGHVARLRRASLRWLARWR